MNKTTDCLPPRPVVSTMSDESSSLRSPPTSPTLAKPKARLNINNNNNNETEKAMLSHVKKAADDTTSAPSKTHKHRKSSSLVGFDPFLANSVEQELSATAAAAASTTPAPTKSTKATPSRPPLNKGVWGSDHDVHNTDHPLLGKPPSSGSGSHRKSAQTMCASDLRDIAAVLSHDKPRKSTEYEEQQMQELMTNITLGTTIDDSKLSTGGRAARPPRTHRKTQSLASVEEYLMSKLKNPRNNIPPMKTARVPTPPPSSAASSAHSSPVTPDQRRGGGTKVMRGAASPGSTTTATPVSSPKPITPYIPTLSKPSPTSFLKDSNTLALKSSEAEPSLHQMDIPSASEAYLYARLCQLLEEYHDEDFKNLVGVSLLQLNGYVNLGKKINGLVDQVHKPIAKFLLQMNVVVEGYLVDKQHLSEVALFGTSSHIIVVFRGATNRQNKPMSKKFKQNAAVALDQEHSNVPVFVPFRDAYFGLEHKVQMLLDRLCDENPFAEVVFTGWSFGAALSTMAGARFASSRPMTRFECSVFSSPKVGQLEWRMYVHSLPNLKVMRFEVPNDPNVVLPMDSADCKWRHCGHTVAITGKQPPQRPIIAYRFDNHKKAFGVMDSVMKLNILQHNKHTIDNYVDAIGEFQSGKLSWVNAYTGEDIGEGVVGQDKEKREMA